LPRPDFVVRRRRAPPQLLDAKYRDIWETDLPREMLYQLAVYAMSQPQGATAAILYPTGATSARESIIEIREPATTSIRAFVALRPVIVPRVLELLRANGDRQRDREMLARKLVFGAAELG
jgi:5-methylcytosine-specific restriction enzyme subunit McrC